MLASLALRAGTWPFLSALSVEDDEVDSRAEGER